MDENADVNVEVEEETPEGEEGEDVEQGANPAGGDTSNNKQNDASKPKEASSSSVSKDVQAKVEVIPQNDDAEVEVEVEVQASVEILHAQDNSADAPASH